MKVSVSLSSKDVEFLDQLARDGAYTSRSAALAEGVRLLRSRDLVAQYAEAIREWVGTEDAALWENTVADGLGDNDGTEADW